MTVCKNPPLRHGIKKGATGPSYSIRLDMRGPALEKYPAKQHARRVARELGVSDGLIYLIGQQTALLEDSDQGVPFRQRRYFFYLSGVDEADCHLTYDIKTDVLTLYVPDFDLKRAIWMGPTLAPKEALQRYDVDKVKYDSTLDSDIQRWGDAGSERSLLYILHERQKPQTNFSNISFDHASLMLAMDACRVIKDDQEIALIKHANKVSAAAHSAVLSGISQMENEAEIKGTFLNTSTSNGAMNQSYDIIAASGSNAAVLHYTKNNEPLQGRQFVCLDAGAEWNCYASDVTRTFPIGSEWPSKEAFDIYSTVQEMQEECISRMREGVRFFDLHNLAHKIAIKELLRLGIFTGGSVEEIFQSGASLIFFPHGLGHHLGLEVHDVAPDSIMGFGGQGRSWTYNTGNDKDAPAGSFRPPCTVSAPTLKAGMVVTVEPGIYFSRLALENAKSKPTSAYLDLGVIERYMPVGGVRIEDDILVTKDGFENLTTATKGEAMLEIIRDRSK